MAFVWLTFEQSQSCNHMHTGRSEASRRLLSSYEWHFVGEKTTIWGDGDGQCTDRQMPLFVTKDPAGILVCTWICSLNKTVQKSPWCARCAFLATNPAKSCRFLNSPVQDGSKKEGICSETCLIHQTFRFLNRSVQKPLYVKSYFCITYKYDLPCTASKSQQVWVGRSETLLCSFYHNVSIVVSEDCSFNRRFSS